MKKQNLKNHARLHPLYHFVALPIILFTFIGSLVHLVSSLINGNNVFLAIIVFSGAVVLSITLALTRIYSMQVQDRVIRAEENFRHFLLTNKMLDSKLEMKQIVALRFASDEEYPSLCEKAVKEKMKPSEIKAAIQQWKADHHRV